MARTPDNYMMPKKKPVSDWPELPEDAPVMMGGQRGTSNVPRGTSVASTPNGPTTRRIGAVNPEADQLKRTLLRQRQQIIQRALMSNDPNERAGLIGERRQLESDIRPLDAARSRLVATPEGKKAGQDRLLLEAQTEIARRQAAGPSPEAPEPLYKTPEQFRMGPNANPIDAVRAKQMYALSKSNPVLEGEGMGMKVTSPLEQEAARQKTSINQRYAALNEPKLPEFDPIDPAAMDARFEDAQGRYEKANKEVVGDPEAGIQGVLPRYKAEAAHRQAMAVKQQELEKSTADAAIAGTDTASLGAQTEQLRAKAAYEEAKRGADRSRPIRPGKSVSAALDTVGTGVPERSGGIRGSLGTDAATDVGVILAGVPGIGPVLGAAAAFALGRPPSVPSEQLDLAFKDIENAAANGSLTLEQRQVMADFLRRVRSEAAGKSGGQQWVDRIQAVLSQIEPGI